LQHNNTCANSGVLIFQEMHHGFRAISPVR